MAATIGGVQRCAPLSSAARCSRAVPQLGARLSQAAACLPRRRRAPCCPTAAAAASAASAVVTHTQQTLLGASPWGECAPAACRCSPICCPGLSTDGSPICCPLPAAPALWLAPRTTCGHLYASPRRHLGGSDGSRMRGAVVRAHQVGQRDERCPPQVSGINCIQLSHNRRPPSHLLPSRSLDLPPLPLHLPAASPAARSLGWRSATWVWCLPRRPTCMVWSTRTCCRWRYPCCSSRQTCGEAAAGGEQLRGGGSASTASCTSSSANRVLQVVLPCCACSSLPAHC